MRFKFAKAFSWARVNQPWSVPIFVNGELTDQPLHIEGYIVNNGEKFFRFHSDLPYVKTRYMNVTNVFTASDYCLAVGRPLDRFDSGTEFWGRGVLPEEPESGMFGLPIEGAEGVANGEVAVEFIFFELNQIGRQEYKPGKIVGKARTKVQLQCPMCECGGKFR